MSLGDSFPEYIKDDFSRRGVELGVVLRLKVADTNPPKIKLFIIVGQTIDSLSVATVYINSNINFKVHFNFELQSLQFPLSEKDYTFLSHNSFVDCSKIYIRLKQDLEEIVKQNPSAVAGRLSKEQLERIRLVIKEAPTIKGKVKKKFGMFL